MYECIHEKLLCPSSIGFPIRLTHASNDSFWFLFCSGTLKTEPGKSSSYFLSSSVRESPFSEHVGKINGRSFSLSRSSCGVLSISPDGFSTGLSLDVCFKSQILLATQPGGYLMAKVADDFLVLFKFSSVNNLAINSYGLSSGL